MRRKYCFPKTCSLTVILKSTSSKVHSPERETASMECSPSIRLHLDIKGCQAITRNAKLNETYSPHKKHGTVLVFKLKVSEQVFSNIF